MIVNSVHLTQQLWLAAAISAFGLTRFAIRRGAHRRWSNFDTVSQDSPLVSS